MLAKRPSCYRGRGGTGYGCRVFRRSQAVLAVLACAGTLMSGGRRQQRRIGASPRIVPALVVHHDATARVATVASTAKFLLQRGDRVLLFDTTSGSRSSRPLQASLQRVHDRQGALAAGSSYHEVKLMITGREEQQAAVVPPTADNRGRREAGVAEWISPAAI